MLTVSLNFFRYGHFKNIIIYYYYYNCMEEFVSHFRQRFLTLTKADCERLFSVLD